MSNVYWVKAPMAAATLPIEVSLRAHAEYRPDMAMFAASMAGAGLPSVPVASGAKPSEVCPLATNFLTGRVVTVADAKTAAFVVVILPRRVLKMGRNHLWRVRDEVASLLPMNIRELLTRRRTGVFDAESYLIQTEAARNDPRRKGL
jgi:hypothetical protein